MLCAGSTGATCVSTTPQTPDDSLQRAGRAPRLWVGPPFVLAVAATIAGVVGGIGSLMLAWLPEADPQVFDWPVALIAITPPALLPLVLRSAPKTARLIAAAWGATVGLTTILAGALVLFILGSR